MLSVLASESAGIGLNDLSYEDHALVSARYYFSLDAEVPEKLLAAAVEVTEAGDTWRVFVLGEHDLAETSATPLQASLNAAVNQIIGFIREVQLSASDLVAAQGRLEVDIALVPDSGQAGLFIGHTELAELTRAGADLLVSAWPGSSWFEAKYPKRAQKEQA